MKIYFSLEIIVQIHFRGRDVFDFFSAELESQASPAKQRFRQAGKILSDGLTAKRRPGRKEIGKSAAGGD
jgi:hypothetical protein